MTSFQLFLLPMVMGVGVLVIFGLTIRLQDGPLNQWGVIFFRWTLWITLGMMSAVLAIIQLQILSIIFQFELIDIAKIWTSFLSAVTIVVITLCISTVFFFNPKQEERDRGDYLKDYSLDVSMFPDNPLLTLVFSPLIPAWVLAVVIAEETEKFTGWFMNRFYSEK